MKKSHKPRSVQVNVAKKRAKRALRSKVKAAHRRSTGHKDISESES